MNQTKNYPEWKQNTHPGEKNQTSIGAIIDFCIIMEESKSTELVEEKEKKFRSKHFITHGIEKSVSATSDGTIKSDNA